MVTSLLLLLAWRSSPPGCPAPVFPCQAVVYGVGPCVGNGITEVWSVDDAELRHMLLYASQEVERGGKEECTGEVNRGRSA